MRQSHTAGGIMSDFSKNDYVMLEVGRKRAFQEIARRLGKEHAITKMMGTLAWGRYKGESGTNTGLRAAVYAVGFLDGFFDALNLWARDHDTNAQQVMLSCYSTSFHVDKS